MHTYVQHFCIITPMLASVYFCILYQVKDHVTNAVIIVLKYIASFVHTVAGIVPDKNQWRWLA